MNGARLSRAISNPLTQPTSMPTATDRTTITQTCGNMIASVSGRFSPGTGCRRRPPVRPTVEPTERSMPPFRMTSSMPSATMALKATCLVIVVRLPAVR